VQEVTFRRNVTIAAWHLHKPSPTLLRGRDGCAPSHRLIFVGGYLQLMEPHIVDRTRNAGWIEVVCGSMFSGKTEELIRRLRRARIARQRTMAFKPALDTRYSDDEVVSHDETSMPTVPVESAAALIREARRADVVGIDEAQFFGNDLVEACQTLASEGIRVVVAGLDQDYKGQPFEPIPQLMAIAEHVTKLHAICVQCGAPANHSQRIVPSDDRVLIGATEAYEPRCRDCFQPTETPKSNAPAPATPVTSSASPEGGE